MKSSMRLMLMALGSMGMSVLSLQAAQSNQVAQYKFTDQALNQAYNLLFTTSGLSDEQLVQELFAPNCLTVDNINTMSNENKTLLDYVTNPAYSSQTVVNTLIQYGAQLSQNVIAGNYYKNQRIVEQKFENEALNKAYNMLVHPANGTRYSSTIVSNLFSNYVLTKDVLSQYNDTFCSLADYADKFAYDGQAVLKQLINRGATTQAMRLQASQKNLGTVSMQFFKEAPLLHQAYMLLKNNSVSQPVMIGDLFYNGFLTWSTLNTLSEENKTFLDYVSELSSPLVQIWISDLQVQGAKFATELAAAMAYISDQTISETKFTDSLLNKIYNILVHPVVKYDASIVQELINNFLLDAYRLNLLSIEGLTLLDYATHFSYDANNIAQELVNQGALLSNQLPAQKFFEHQSINVQMFADQWVNKAYHILLIPEMTISTANGLSIVNVTYGPDIVQQLFDVGILNSTNMNEQSVEGWSLLDYAPQSRYWPTQIAQDLQRKGMKSFGVVQSQGDSQQEFVQTQSSSDSTVDFENQQTNAVTSFYGGDQSTNILSSNSTQNSGGTLSLSSIVSGYSTGGGTALQSMVPSAPSAESTFSGSSSVAAPYIEQNQSFSSASSYNNVVSAPIQDPNSFYTQSQGVVPDSEDTFLIEVGTGTSTVIPVSLS